VQYDGPQPETNIPQWMDEKYQVFYQNPHEVMKLMLVNKLFDGNFDYTPYQQYDDQLLTWGSWVRGVHLVCSNQR